ncbi:MAG: type II toxin-antitoxin system RelE/ParE family toxin [Microvirga sp.]
MKPRSVVISPEAAADLLRLYDWIAEAGSPNAALAYLERIEAHLNGYALASERGTKRDDIRPGMRISGFERRITIAFTVEAERVTILRLLYGGQDWERPFEGA